MTRFALQMNKACTSVSVVSAGCTHTHTHTHTRPMLWHVITAWLTHPLIPGMGGRPRAQEEKKLRKEERRKRSERGKIYEKHIEHSLFSSALLFLWLLLLL